jgi:hypothetical protein
MQRMERRTTSQAAVAGGLLGLLAAAGLASASPAALPPVPPLPPPGGFVRTIDNPYLPFRPGTTFVHRGTKDRDPTEVRVTVTRATKRILGVRTVVVLDRSTVAGRPEEKTYDWYAQDRRGNVWYFGEDSFDYVKGKWVRNDGSWQAGVGGARPGIVMEAAPKPGDTYRQEFRRGTQRISRAY